MQLQKKHAQSITLVGKIESELKTLRKEFRSMLLGSAFGMKRRNAKWSALTSFARHNQLHLNSFVVIVLCGWHWLWHTKDVRTDHFAFLLFIPNALPRSIHLNSFLSVFSSLPFLIVPTITTCMCMFLRTPEKGNEDTLSAWHQHTACKVKM